MVFFCLRSQNLFLHALNQRYVDILDSGLALMDGEALKSASSPVRAGKFKKQQRAWREYVRPKEWKDVCHYATSGRAQLDAEDIEFDIYKKSEIDGTERYENVARTASASGRRAPMAT